MFIVDYIRKSVKSDEFSPKKSKAQPTDRTALTKFNFSVLKKLSQGRFPVYQVLSKDTSQEYVMKLFPYKDNEPNTHYQNETRFALLKHPNIINIIYHGSKTDASNNNFSYILMDYASHGDLFSLLSNHGDSLTEKIIRTYFRQLIEGLEYLHAKHMAHLDLKPENLLLDPDFQLKIADFDLSYVEGDAKILSKGTKSYRAPELFRANRSEDLQFKSISAADIYSTGIILFMMMSGGTYPYLEDQEINGVPFLHLLNNNIEEFWLRHCEFQGRPASFYSKNFKELFNGMMRPNPEQRFNIKQIKKSKWYNGPVYNSSKLQRKMAEVLIKN